MRSVFLSLLLTACGGISQEKFDEQYIEKSCALLMECADEETSFISFESEADCVGFLGLFWGSATEGCDYDSKAAADCLDELDSATCEATSVAPSSCSEVYTGDSCQVFSSSTDTGF